MKTQNEIPQNRHSVGAGFHEFKQRTQEVSREQWLHEYAARILWAWSYWRIPLGIKNGSTDKIKKDLARFYDDPLKKMMIEATY